MTFKEKIANFVLGNHSIVQLPEIAIVALNEGLESESLLILAGMSNKDNTFEIETCFKKSIEELGYELPNKISSAKIVLEFYLRLILIKNEKAFDIMSIINNKIYRQFDWEKEPKRKGKKYVGDELGLERMFTWYRELQDLEDNGVLLFFKDLPKEKQKEKFEWHLVNEAKELLNKLNKEKLD